MGKRLRIVLFIVGLTLLLIILPIGSIFIRELIEVYKLSFTSIPDGYVLIKLQDISTYKEFFTKVNPPNAISWFILGVYVIGFLLGSWNDLRIHKTYTQKDTYGSHGTARFQSKKDIKNNYAKDKFGWFIGSSKPNLSYKINMDGVYHKLNGKLNMQTVVVGPPGSIKTTGLVLPNLFHIPHMYKNTNEQPDLIITDPKSELFSLTANYYEQLGYDVRVLDFIHLKYGDTFNSLDFITDEKELMEIADGYVLSIESAQGSDSKEKFWAEQEGQALGALIGAVKQTRPKDKQNFTEVLRLLTDKLTDSYGCIDIEKARNFFDENVKGAALQLWKNFLMLSKSENTAGNILGGLAGKMKLFAIDGIQNITNSTTIDIRKLGAKRGPEEKPTALFIFMPDKDRTFSPVINVVLTTILNQLYKTAYKYEGNKLYNPVYFILEEMANVGRLSGILEMLGTMRGRRIYPMMIWQSLSQMKNRYKDGWEDIMSMCDTHIYLGVNDEFTAKYCSNSLGNTTIKTQGVSRTPKGYGVEHKSEVQNYTQRPLLFPDEVKVMDNNNIIVVQRSLNPFIAKKVQYKHWEKNNRICEPKKVEELPLIIQSNNVELPDTNTEVISITESHTKERKKELNVNHDIHSQSNNVRYNPFNSNRQRKQKDFNPFR